MLNDNEGFTTYLKTKILKMEPKYTKLFGSGWAFVSLFLIHLAGFTTE